MKSIKYVLLLFLFIKSIIAHSQSSCDSMAVCDCASKDLSPAGIMLSHEHAKGTWKISYTYNNMTMKGRLSGTTKVDDNYVFNTYIMSPQSMRMDMHMLMGMYGITNRLSVMAMFNFNMLSMKMSAIPGSTMQMDGRTMVMTVNSTDMSTKSSGLGDTKLYAVYALVNHNVHHVFLSAGFSIPTGSIDVKGKAGDMMYPNSRMPYMMQLGSGTFDCLPGLTYLMKRNKLSASIQVTSIIRTMDNSNNYRLPNEVTTNAWVAYKWFPWISTSLRVERNNVGKMSGVDMELEQITEPAAFYNNYGGEYTTAFGGINFYFNKTWFKNTKLSVEYGMPLYQSVNGIQLAQKSTLYASWLVSF